jgi:hypothetical protein
MIVTTHAICSDVNCEFKGQLQPSENFSKHIRRKNGLESKCKVCLGKIHKKRYENNPDAARERTKNWRHRRALYDTFVDKISTYEETRRDPENQQLLQVKCNLCGNWFNPKNLNIQNRIDKIQRENSSGEARLYCSDECRIACPVYHRGNTPKPDDWIPGKYKNSDGHKRPMQGQLREMVLERDKYTCIKCGITGLGVKLICHHIESVSQNPIESADVDNCITVCETCDKQIHSQSGCKTYELRCKK